MKIRQQNSDDYIQLSTLLESLREQESFRTPDGYFENLPDIIQHQIQQIPDFEKSAVVNPFTVPQDYFEKLPFAVSQAVEQSQHASFSLRTLIAQFKRPSVSLAFASLALVLFISIRFFSREIIIQAPDSGLTVEELTHSVSLDELDENMLIDLLAEQNQDASVNDQNQNIEQYLIDNDIDITQLESRL